MNINTWTKVSPPEGVTTTVLLNNKLFRAYNTPVITHALSREHEGLMEKICLDTPRFVTV